MREVIIYSDTLSPKFAKSTPVEVARGYFHAWGNESDTSSEGIAVDAVALVELEDGRVDLVHPSHMRFAVPFSTTAKLAATPANIARACGMENEVERAAEVSATNPPKGWRLAKAGDVIQFDSLAWKWGRGPWAPVEAASIGTFCPEEWCEYPAVKIEVAP